MKTVLDITDLKDKKVLLRTDFDVPLSDRGEIEEDFRIKKQKPMIEWLIERGAKVVMVAHISSVESFKSILSQLERILGREVNLVPFENSNIKELIRNLNLEIGNLTLLDNIRQFSEEKENDENFAKALADDFDIYINNAFAVSHRKHSSVSAVAELLPSYAGLLVQEEVANLKKAIDAPKEGKVVIIGGAKAATKVPVVKNFIDKAELILLGGVVANDVLKAKGQDMGSSVVDENYQELLTGLDINDPRLLVPEDFVVFDNKILDIGEKTIRKYSDAVKKASMIIWNGPAGLFENSAFAMGTQKLSEAIAASKAYKIVGGGDTISAISKFKIQNSKFNFISTGGGAMLAFLAGQRLPGLEALGYYE